MQSNSIAIGRFVAKLSNQKTLFSSDISGYGAFFLKNCFLLREEFEYSARVQWTSLLAPVIYPDSTMSFLGVFKTNDAGRFFKVDQSNFITSGFLFPGGSGFRGVKNHTQTLFQFMSLYYMLYYF